MDGIVGYSVIQEVTKKVLKKFTKGTPAPHETKEVHASWKA